MAGGALKYRHLDRKSSHRQALLRNLVTSLFEHESISTTWPKAKEAQRLAEKLITLGKKNTEDSRRTAQGIFYSPLEHVPKLFTTLRERYLHRPGGYTRVLRIEPRNRNHDQAPSAILELVDGPKDMRFALTAKTIVRERARDDPTTTSSSSSSSSRPPPKEAQQQQQQQQLGGVGLRDFTAKAIRKVTRFRPDGLEALEREVARLERFQEDKEREEEKKNLRERKERRKQEMEGAEGG